MTKMKYKTEDHFSDYLAGLWEGDGHVYIYKTVKKQMASWCITFNEKDDGLVQALKKKLGGSIFHKKEEHCKVLTIGALASLKAVIELTHNAYRSPKVRQVNELITWLNENKGTSYPLCKVKKASLMNNAWLTGFIEADGCFFIEYRPFALKKSANGITRIQRRLIGCRFHLVQRMEDPKSGDSYGPLMDQICETLGVRLAIYPNKKTQKSYFRIKGSSVASNTTLVKYLNRFPLFGSKGGSFKVWCSVLAKLKAKQAYAPEYAEELIGLKKIINKETQVCDELLLEKL